MNVKERKSARERERGVGEGRKTRPDCFADLSTIMTDNCHGFRIGLWLTGCSRLSHIDDCLSNCWGKLIGIGNWFFWECVRGIVDKNMLLLYRAQRCRFEILSIISLLLFIVYNEREKQLLMIQRFLGIESRKRLNLRRFLCPSCLLTRIPSGKLKLSNYRSLKMMNKAMSVFYWKLLKR